MLQILSNSYQGAERYRENIGKPVTWHVTVKRSKRKALPKEQIGPSDGKAGAFEGSRAERKSSIRSMSSRTCPVIVKRAIAA